MTQILFMEEEDNGAPEYDLVTLQKRCTQCNWRGEEVYYDDKHDRARASQALKERHRTDSPQCKEDLTLF